MDKLVHETGQISEEFSKSGKIELGSDGWLSPKGDYYKAGSSEHDACAKFLVHSSPEVNASVKEKFSDPNDKEDYEDKNDREKLKELGWILVRGKILHSEDALNFTPAQLKAISDAGVKVVSAFDGSKEYSSEEVQTFLGRIKKDLYKSGIIRRLGRDLAEGDFSPWFARLKQRTINDLNNFNKDPFHTIIYTSEVNDYDEQYERVPSEIFDLVSQGYSEEMTILGGSDKYTFRKINLKTGEQVWAERRFHVHEDSRGGLKGDYDNYISIYVVDDILMRQKLDKIIEYNNNVYGPPKLTFQVKDGYFEKFFSHLLLNN